MSSSSAARAPHPPSEGRRGGLGPRRGDKKPPGNRLPPAVIPPAALEQQERARVAAARQQEEEVRAQERQLRTAALQEAIQTLQVMSEAAAQHAAARALFQNPEALKQVRADFELSKKSIKVDLKKCTTFIKKIRLGTYFTQSTTAQNSSHAAKMWRP
jgi:hypothetical protein